MSTNTSNPVMDPVAEYMLQRKWSVDQKSARKRYLCSLARQSKQDKDLSSKIGGMLIYNQVIEQLLSDIVEMSIYYIKAQIWPVSVSLDIELDSSTFGKVIEYFKQFATVEPRRDEILAMLRKFNIKRNHVVHDLFDIQDLKKLSRELDGYAELADEIIRMLDDYSDQVCENFCQLEKRRDFRRLTQ